MFTSILQKLKNKGFWAGVATTLAAVLGGAMTLPEAVIGVLTSLIGG